MPNEETDNGPLDDTPPDRSALSDNSLGDRSGPAIEKSASQVDEARQRVFERHRQHLLGLAYRMTGSLAEAEDILQDAFLRFSGVELSRVKHPKGYLSQLVTRLCLDQAKSARAQREQYVGPWLPEPVLDSGALTADAASELASDISIALMLALERLSPLERAAFLLHDVFDVDYGEVSKTLARSEDACRQLAARARKQVQQARPRYTASTVECQRLIAAFSQAALSGDTEQLEQVLAEDVVFYSDGGGKVLAALKPIQGRGKVARFVVGVRRKFPLAPDATFHQAKINGLSGVVIQEGGKTLQTLAFELRDGRISAVYTMRNPDKLRNVSLS